MTEEKNEVIYLPDDVMDYIGKSSSWLNGMCDNFSKEHKKNILGILNKMADRLLNKYDFEYFKSDSGDVKA